VAVRVAVELLLMVAVVALKFVEVAPAATVIDAGTESIELVVARTTLAPLAGAGWVRVTVQALEEFGTRLVGVQASEETNTGAARLTVVLAELPL
jgi:hypothetical protein